MRGHCIARGSVVAKMSTPVSRSACHNRKWWSRSFLGHRLWEATQPLAHRPHHYPTLEDSIVPYPRPRRLRAPPRPCFQTDGTISSILSGAVYGDHCSPISDTTVMSALATKCDLRGAASVSLIFCRPETRCPSLPETVDGL